MQKEHKQSLSEPLIKKDADHSKQQRVSMIESLFTNYYLVFAALSGILLGSNNFMTDYSVKQIDSYRVYCLTGFGMLTYFTLYHGTLAYKMKQKKGYFWSRRDSYYFTEVSDLDGNL
jgi:hypothetical protein